MKEWAMIVAAIMGVMYLIVNYLPILIGKAGELFITEVLGPLL